MFRNGGANGFSGGNAISTGTNVRYFVVDDEGLEGGASGETGFAYFDGASWELNMIWFVVDNISVDFLRQ